MNVQGLHTSSLATSARALLFMTTQSEAGQPRCMVGGTMLLHTYGRGAYEHWQGSMPLIGCPDLPIDDHNKGQPHQSMQASMDDDAFKFWKHHGLQRLTQKFAQEAATPLTDVSLLWKDETKTELGMSLGARKPLGKSCRGFQAVGTNRSAESTGGAPP